MTLAMGLLLAREGGAIDHWTFYCLSSELFKLLSGSTLDLLPFYNHLYYGNVSRLPKS
jgi:hypothetical protein